MTRAAQSSIPAPAAECIANRYDLHELLGRGGMACVHLATDRVTSRKVALKQLTAAASAPEYASVAALFEREFHTLVQLRHPHVIEVYDYGVREDGCPFYTMELLDGGDLRERAPLGWREACRVSFHACSALALLHSRRLLHRDVSPRNIRCTHDGHAKLIDFGAMSSMGDGGAEVVGTPAFTAPETVQRLALDARTDLYSLGVTLYYALTARLPYAARSFAELFGAWRVKPLPPSQLVADIPVALDDLVLSLISVEPELRPQTAFDVMQRLAACADLRAEESEAVSRAYLSTPLLVGRDQLLAQLRDELRNARLTRVRGVVLEGAAGAGRSRLLDACVLEAQTRGFTVLRASANGARESFANARALTDHLLDSLPLGQLIADFQELFAAAPAPSAAPVAANDSLPAPRPTLRSFVAPGVEPARVQRALRELWVNVSRTHPLLIAVDDVHKIDEPSAALLAELIDKAKGGGVLVALTADSSEASGAGLSALARRCTTLQLAPLTLEETRELLGSLFGDVAHLAMLASEIQRVALGNPGQTLELAQHLVDRGVIRYTAGSWTLPSALSADDVPQNMATLMRARIARLPANARFMAEAQALAYYETFSDQDYRLLMPELGSSEIEIALAELLAAQALVSDGTVYTLANRLWVAALTAELDSEQTRLRHQALTDLYRAKASFAAIHHAFLAGRDAEALAALDTRNDVYRTEADLLSLVQQNVGKMAWCYPRAIETAQALGRHPRDVYDLRRWHTLANVVNHDSPDLESARIWYEQLAHDAGLDLYRQDTESTNPGERLTRALQNAYARYLATPEDERVYPVDQAIRKLGEYVVISIAVGARTLQTDLLRGLPEILEPFVALSPLLEAIWLNARACRDSHCLCDYERARELWRDAFAKLDGQTGSEEAFVEGMRNAIAYAIGMMDAQLGLASAADWAERLDHDPYQRLSALDLRRIVRLEQGDSAGAERLRRQAEILALQLRVPQMFKTLLSIELAAYANSRDLKGVAYVIEQMKPLAARFAGWQPYLLVAEGHFHAVRGDYEAAKAKFEQSLTLTCLDERDDSRELAMWLTAHAGVAECLFALGRSEDARAFVSTAVSYCEAHEIKAASYELVRVLGLAEAKLGDPRGAQRLDALIAAQNELGVTGLRIGLSYEARARSAIWSGDVEAFERFAELSAREYRHGARTGLAARYERLINDAARGGMQTRVALGDFEALAGLDTSALGSEELLTVITRSMAGSRSADERAQLALQMICAAHGVQVGHLYLLTAAGLMLRGSRGDATPPAELAEQLTHYVTERQQRSEDMDDMVTGELPPSGGLVSMLQTAERDYELLPLGCVDGALSKLAGVAVIEVGETRNRNDKQAQLLHAIAASLLQSGDSQGLTLASDEDA